MSKLLSIEAIARPLITGLGVLAVLCSPFPGLAQENNSHLDRYRQRIADFPADLEAARQEGKKEEARVLHFAGDAYLYIGNYEEAKKHLTRSLQLYREIYGSKPKPEGLPHIVFRPHESDVFNALVIAHEKLGDIQGLTFLESELAVITDAERRKMILLTLGNSYRDYLGEATFARAVETWQEYLQLSKQTNDIAAQSNALSALGSIYGEFDDYSRAINYLQQAVATVSSSDKLHEYGFIMNYLPTLAIYQRKNGDFDAALATVDRAQEASRTIYRMAGGEDKAEEKDWSLKQKALIYSAAEDYERAIVLHQQRIELARENASLIEEGNALNALSSTLFWQGDLPRALEMQQKSLDRYLEYSKEIASGMPGAIAMAREVLAFFLLRSERFPEAEQQIRLAIESANLRYQQYRFDGQSSRASTDLNNLWGQASFADTYRVLQEIYIASDRTEEALEASERGRARAFSQLISRRLEGESGHPPLEFSSPNIEEIKAIAKAEQTTIVEYSIIFKTNRNFRYLVDVELDPSKNPAEKLYIWVVKPTGEVHFREVPLEGDLIKLIGQARGLISSSKQLSRRLQVSLQKLHGVLIEPIADLLPADPSDRITFIPQEILFYVPFPALIDGGGQSLIEKHTILTAPSIQVLSLSRQVQEHLTPNSKAFVLGNPEMPTLPRTPHADSHVLASLPGAEEEAKTISQMFGTKPLLGSDATKAKTIAKMEEAGIIHIATHGLLDRSGLLASLALAPTRDDDGFLAAREIANLNLSAELVVLSACDTGRGEFYEGEGVVGLTRAFLSAGASNLVMSLWPVPDNATAVLMTEFYQSWQGGMSKAEALRQGMLATKAQFPNPKNWAAFSIVGTGD
ncbi:MAG: CHAT domain-containing protein [Cyanobacteria bacterium SBLK]|nr:CHAT domain-containing protein [Cyanobacteria bacterium SBLK]